MSRPAPHALALVLALVSVSPVCATEPSPTALTIHVDASSGFDSNPGTQALPRRTIGAGIAAIPMGMSGQVFVAAGVYAESVVLRSGVSLFGRFEAAGWTRDPGNRTTISGGTTAVLGAGLTQGLVVDGFRILSASASVAGDSSYAVRLVDSNASVTLTRNELMPARGANGLDGDDGTPGVQGARGGDGQNGCDGCQSAATGAGGAVAAVGPAAARGSRGGDGGFDAVGQGGPGAPGGAQGGFAGSLAMCPGNSGDGGPGMAGADGVDGIDGENDFIAIAPAPGPLYVHLESESGTAGANGTGGGGGGGGGGGDGGFCDADEGGGGSAGGNGAIGATPGTAGRPGGGAFALYVYSAAAHVDRVSVDMTRGAPLPLGGRGGAGGNGAAGNTGGTGGTPGQARAEGGAGGMGGRGGDSGASGSGAGGRGGVAVGIHSDGTSPITVGTVRYYASAQGVPGAGGSGPLGTADAGSPGAVRSGFPASVPNPGAAIVAAVDATFVRDPAGGPIAVPVTLGPPTDQDVVFGYTVVPDTATAVDVQTGTFAGVIGRWEDGGTVSVTVEPAAATVPDRQFFVQLSSPSGAQLGDAVAAITLLSPTFFGNGFE